MKVFLTGATGSIGTAILTNLIKNHHTVTCLVRDPAKGEALVNKHGPNCNIAVLNLNAHTGDDLAALAVNHDAIIHTAVDYFADMQAVEMAVTRALIKAAQQTSADRHVTMAMCSGYLVLGDQEGPITESSPTTHPFPMAAFRLEAEQVALAANAERLTVAVVRPGAVYGGSHIEILLNQVKATGRIPVFVKDNYVSVDYVDYVGRAFVAVVERKGTGIFHVSEEPVKVSQIVQAIKEASGVHEEFAYENPMEHYPVYGAFVLLMVLNQQIPSTRIIDEYGVRSTHNLLDYIRNYYKA